MLRERDLLGAARAGDEDAFRRLVGPHLDELHAHCHRMLGSVHDAEDALQDALLRAWRGLGGFDSRESLRPWLFRIATNASLDALARRQKRPVPVGTESPEQSVSSAAAQFERRETVERALAAALQHLPGRQGAVLILREVLDFSAKEVAAALDTTPASINSALQRARKTADERLPEPTRRRLDL